jgi:hypothetical protein
MCPHPLSGVRKRARELHPNPGSSRTNRAVIHGQADEITVDHPGFDAENPVRRLENNAGMGLGSPLNTALLESPRVQTSKAH